MTSRKWKPKDGWRVKLHDDKDLPKIVRPSAKGRKHLKCETMLIAGPRDVDSTIRKARKKPPKVKDFETSLVKLA